MQIQLHSQLLNSLAQHLRRERVVQNLSREQLAAVCDVSPSFIRDVESNPGRCSLELVLRVVQGLGLRASVGGWEKDIRTESDSDASAESPLA
ncbi:MAG: helix-turn-helix domain-containing protein [Pseudomonadota bacterium]